MNSYPVSVSGERWLFGWLAGLGQGVAGGFVSGGWVVEKFILMECDWVWRAVEEPGPAGIRRLVPRHRDDDEPNALNGVGNEQSALL